MAKVLIAEDEKDLLELYAKAFQNEGFETITAADGEEGLTRALEAHPDLILIDIQMPKMNGIEMLRKLREDPWGKLVPAVMLTNLGGTREISDSMSLKISRYIIKAETNPMGIVDEVKNILSGENQVT